MPSQPPAAQAPAVARPHISTGVILAIACLAQFMVVLDTTIVNVALPAMREDLGLSTVDQQWVVDGYLITFGGLLLLAARAGDLFGRRVVFVTGLVVFTLSSLAGGLADSGTVLLIARFVQGVGAAALAPASLSLITASHPAGPLRTRALSIWSATAASAGAVGTVVGGLLTTLSWRWTLIVNVPIGAVLLVATLLCLVGYTATESRRRLDIPGALAVTIGVGALVFGISQAVDKGWGSGEVLGAIAGAVVLLGLFVIIEQRTAQPLVPLSIFRHRSLSGANLIMACVGIVLTAEIFFLSLYLQQVEGYSALKAGLSMLPLPVMLVSGSLLSRGLVPRVGPGRMIVGGALITAVGVGWLSRLPDQSDYLGHIFGPMILSGIGMSLLFLPITLAGTSDLGPRDAGLASGLINMGRQIGGALGLAVLVTIAASSTSRSGLTGADATIHGYRDALLIAAIVAAVAAVIGLTLPRPGRVRLAAQSSAPTQGGAPAAADRAA
ncbi:MAG TPA: MFS transporter [Conexibacter sp.]|jgi:EmrB/QacA subfamily drug resistance transporter